jgi:branched-chain amino acid transport system substrate-binding protein
MAMSRLPHPSAHGLRPIAMKVRKTRRLATVGVLLAVCSVSLVACGNRLPPSTLLSLARGPAPHQGSSANSSNALRATGGSSSGGGAAGATQTNSGGTGSTAGGSAAGSTGGAGASSGSGSSGGGGQQSQAAGCSGTGATINIGSVGELSGVFAPSLQSIVTGVAAWVAATNARGGLECHPIKYITADDGGDPSVDLSKVQQMVQQDHVIAFVGMVAPIAGNAAVSYLAQQGIPVIGSEGGSQWFYQSPDYFPQDTSADPALAGFISAAAELGKPQGLTKIASVTCIEVSLCSDLYGQIPALAQKYGLDLVYRGQASLTTPDFTSNCQAAKQAGAQLFAVGMDTNSIERVLSACASIGYHPLFFTGGALATPALAQDAQAEGLIDLSYVAPFTQVSNPQVAAMQAAIKQYAPGVPLSPGTMVGWVAGLLFAEAAQHLSATPTSKDLLQSLWSIKNDDLGGTTQPLTFAQGQNTTPQICFWTLQIHNGGFIQTGSPNRVCG